MTGVVYLGGGGSGQDEAHLWAEMLEDCESLLYWPFALEGDMLAGAEEWLLAQLAQRGFSGEVQTWTTLEGKDATRLDDVGLLFVGGGNTFSLLHHLRAHGFVVPVRQWVEVGGRYYGGSAGAVLATDSIAIAGYADSNAVGLRDVAGLGLLPGVALLPHYTADQQGRARSISRDLGRPVVALPGASGLVVKMAPFGQSVLMRCGRSPPRKRPSTLPAASCPSPTSARPGAEPTCHCGATNCGCVG